jgi:hypothetical protein
LGWRVLPDFLAGAFAPPLVFAFAGAGFVAALAGLAPRRPAIASLTIAPSRAMLVPLASSSSQSMASSFVSLSMNGSMKA